MKICVLNQSFKAGQLSAPPLAGRYFCVAIPFCLSSVCRVSVVCPLFNTRGLLIVRFVCTAPSRLFVVWFVWQFLWETTREPVALIQFRYFFYYRVDIAIAEIITIVRQNNIFFLVL